jgi:gas vesicle protein
MIARTGRTVIGLLLAFAAGAAVGLLWAPAAGTRTRKALAKKGEALGGRAAAAWGEAGKLLAKGKRRFSA